MYLPFLQHQKYTLQSVPNQDELVYLLTNANLSTGGAARDVTSEVHPDFRESIFKILKFNIVNRGKLLLKILGIGDQKLNRERTFGYRIINSSRGCQWFYKWFYQHLNK